MLDIGSRLKEARLSQGLTLQAIEEDTKISSRYLRAMEENNFFQLPGTAYAIGFLKIYSKYLSLNSEEIVEAFKESANFKETPKIIIDTEENDNNTLAKLNRSPWQKWRIGVLISLIFIISAGGFLYYLGSRPPVEPPGGNMADEEPQAPYVPDENILDPDIPDEVIIPEPVITGIELEIVAANGPCWLRAQGSEETAEHNLKKGDKILIKDPKFLKVKYGSAGAVDVYLNGALQLPLGAVGAVREQEYFAEQ